MHISTFRISLLPFFLTTALSSPIQQQQQHQQPNQPSSLLITLSTPLNSTFSDLDLHPTLLQSYHGSYGSAANVQDHIFLVQNSLTAGAELITQENRLNSDTEEKTFFWDNAQSGSLVEIEGTFSGSGADERGWDLVWVGEAGVEGKMNVGLEGVGSAMEGVWESISTLANRHQGSSESSPSESQGGRDQVVFANINAPFLDTVEILQSSAHSLILKVPHSLLPIIDTFLPSHLSLILIPSTPYSSPRSNSTFVSSSSSSPSATLFPPVPAHILSQLSSLTSNLTFSPKLDQILDAAIDDHVLVRAVRYLTGESGSGIESRHSFNPGSRVAAKWIGEYVNNTDSKVSCTLQPFFPGFSPNVICVYPSYPSTNSSSTSSTIKGEEEESKEELVILSAHYDSRGSFGMTRAPGGDDDGSGSGHLLAIAEGIARLKIKFHKTVVLAFFAGEEQGLVGSGAYAKLLQERNATVLMQIQADMLGYHDPSEPMQMGLPATIGTPEVAELLTKLAGLYSPELVVGKTAACCSDHQRFVERGFPATQVFERNGPIIDPMYHNSGDLSLRTGYDFDQIKSIGKVTLSGVMSVAGWEIEE